MFLLKISKRKRFLITSVLLAGGFVFLQTLGDAYRFVGIAVLGATTLLLFVWSLWEGLGWNATLLSLVLPIYYTVGVGLFWFLLPSSVLARVPVVILYGVGIYALVLTANIYTVSAIRTIALLRAAKGIGFVLTLGTAFLVLDAVLSSRPSQILGVVMVLVVSIPLFYQALWVSGIGHNFDRTTLLMSAVFSLILAEIYAALYFWPVTVVVGSLFLTTGVYVLLGLGQARLEQRLFGQTLRDYLTVGFLVMLGMFIATRWA